MSPRFSFVSLIVLACWLAPLCARAQGPVLVLPWTIGDGDAASVQATAEALSLAIPSSVGAVVSIPETRTRFETTDSSDAPVVTSAELERWTTLSRQAVRDLANEDYAAARHALEQASEISDRAAAEMSREEARARQVLDTCLFGVRAYIEEQDPHAEDQMLGCRRLVPRIAPSPNIHTPEVVELLTRIDRRLTTAHRGPLSVESQPAGCTVRLNGIAIGQTPFTSEQLAPGEYRVQVECGESGHGRVHRVSVPETQGPVSLRVDARLDRAVRSDGVLRLSYADAPDADAHRVIDAATIGAALGASEVWLVGVGPDGMLSGDRVRVADGVAIASASSVGTSTTALVNALTASAGASRPLHASAEIQPGTWVLLFGGGALAIAGGVMLGLGIPDLGAIGAPHMGETIGAATSRQSTGETLTGVGGAALGVGVALVAIGVVLAVSDTSRHDDAQATLRLGPSGAELTLHF